MIVMLTQDLSKGFVSWKEMYFENQAALEALGGKLIFAGPHKEDDNKMVGWSYDKISEHLGVSKMTVSRSLKSHGSLETV